MALWKLVWSFQVLVGAFSPPTGRQRQQRLRWSTSRHGDAMTKAEQARLWNWRFNLLQRAGESCRRNVSCVESNSAAPGRISSVPSLGVFALHALRTGSAPVFGWTRIVAESRFPLHNRTRQGCSNRTAFRRYLQGSGRNRCYRCAGCRM